MVNIMKKDNNNYVFALMPFNPSFDELYYNIIKTSIEEFGYACLRADEQVGSRRIMDDIWNSIKEAKFLIADLTGKNPNVFYELGLAHALEKAVILLTQSFDDVPFDLKHIRIIKYNNNQEGRKKLFDNLKATIKKINVESNSYSKTEFNVLDSPKVFLSEPIKNINVFKAGIAYGKFYGINHIIHATLNNNEKEEYIENFNAELKKYLSFENIDYSLPTWIYELKNKDLLNFIYLCKNQVQNKLSRLSDRYPGLFNLGFSIVLPSVSLFWIGDKSDLQNFTNNIIRIAYNSELPDKFVNRLSNRFEKYFEKEHPQKDELISNYFKKLDKKIIDCLIHK